MRRKANRKMTINTIQLVFQGRRGKEEERSRDLRFCHRHTSHQQTPEGEEDREQRGLRRLRKTLGEEGKSAHLRS